MAIFRELLHSSPLELTLVLLLGRWLGGVFASTRCREPNFLAPARPAQAPHTRALPPLWSALQSLAAMRPSPSYVLAALYLLEDTNAERFQDVRAKAHGKLLLEELILQEQRQALRLFREVVLCGRPAS